jgi:hypothetical protein
MKSEEQSKTVGRNSERVELIKSKVKSSTLSELNQQSVLFYISTHLTDYQYIMKIMNEN